MQGDFYTLPKPTDPAPADTLVERYLAGECLLDEQAAMERWIAANPRPGLAWRTMRAEGMAEATDAHAHIDVEAAEHHLIAASHWQRAPRMEGYAAYDTGVQRPSRTEYHPETGTEFVAIRRKRSGGAPRRFIPTWWWSALMLAVAVFCAIGTYRIAPSLFDRASNLTPVHQVQYVTTTGQRRVFTLPDGSQVTLAPQTTLQLDADFGRSSRVMTLDGEAYFEVVPHPRMPFLIHTGAIMTRVLGTTFSVRRYADDANVRVDVYSGRVAVSANTPYHPSVILTAGVTGVVSDTSATTAVIGDGSHPRWIDGQLVFHKVPVPQVLAAMTRWYGYEFRLADSSLLHKNLTVWLSTESSREALATLRVTLDVDVSLDGTVVTLKPRRAAQHVTPPSRDPRTIFSPRTREVGR